MDCRRGSMEMEVTHLEALNPGSKCAYVHGQFTVRDSIRVQNVRTLTVTSRSVHG